MGTFFTEVQLASPTRPARREIVKLLVDSGSLYTWVSAAVLRDLGVHPTEHPGRIRGLVLVGAFASYRRNTEAVTLWADDSDAEALVHCRSAVPA
jgi:hypothetical protein